MNYFRFFAVGRLGDDPVMRYTPQGTAVVNFSFAVNTGWGDNQKTRWFRITMWGKTAETANEYLRKGMLTLLSGTDTDIGVWNDKATGEARGRTELTAHEYRILQPRDSQDHPEHDFFDDRDDAEDIIPY